MKALATIAALLLTLSAARPLHAVETSSAEAFRNRATSSLEQVSTKPLMLFSMRGRLDPFMAYALVTTTASTEYFSIANLTFSGVIEVQGSTTALFKDNHGQTYTVKGAGLYGPDGKRLEGVRGRVGPDKDVSLEQGEKKIVYSAKSTSKRLESARSR